MKIYNYKCLAKGCGFEFESRIDDPERLCCPSCFSKVKKVFPVPVVIFNGSGFYSTDNKKGK